MSVSDRTVAPEAAAEVIPVRVPPRTLRSELRAIGSMPRSPDSASRIVVPV